MVDLIDATGQELEVGDAVVFAYYAVHCRLDGVGYPMSIGRIEQISETQKRRSSKQIPMLVVSCIDHSHEVKLWPKEVVKVPVDLWAMCNLRRD
jgi:hypothetical protein